MYVNLHKAGLGGFADRDYWSSSEGGNGAGSAWDQYFGDGYYCSCDRNLTGRVRAVRAF
jgi:hypothetical protein